MSGEKQIVIEANSVDNDGIWEYEGKRFPLLGNYLPVPKNARGQDPREQEVLAMFKMKSFFNNCPHCNAEVEDDSIMLVTEFTKIFVAHCCNEMVLIKDERDYNEIYEA